MRALLAIGDPALRAVWDGVLAERGHAVRRAAPGPAAVLAAERDLPDLVIAERSATADALQLCRLLRRRQTPGRPAPVILVVLQPSHAGERTTAHRLGADDVLLAPLEPAAARAHLLAAEGRFRPPAPAPPVDVGQP